MKQVRVNLCVYYFEYKDIWNISKKSGEVVGGAGRKTRTAFKGFSKVLILVWDNWFNIILHTLEIYNKYYFACIQYYMKI